MSDYLDEKIIAQRTMREREKHKTLADGIYVREALTLFMRIPLFDKEITVVLPDFGEPLNSMTIGRFWRCFFLRSRTSFAFCCKS